MLVNRFYVESISIKNNCKNGEIWYGVCGVRIWLFLL